MYPEKVCYSLLLKKISAVLKQTCLKKYAKKGKLSFELLLEISRKE